VARCVPSGFAENSAVAGLWCCGCRLARL